MKKTEKFSSNVIRFLALSGLCTALALGMPHQASASEPPVPEGTGEAILDNDEGSSLSGNTADGLQDGRSGNGSGGQIENPDGSNGSGGQNENPDGNGSGGQAGNPNGNGSSGQNENPDGNGSGGQNENPDGDASGQQPPSASHPFSVDAAGRITGLNTAYLDQLTPQQRGSLSLAIPASIDGTRITEIAPGAFAAASYSAAYPDLQIRGLTLPAKGSLVSIGDAAFQGCSGLTGVLILPVSLTSVGARAFAETGYSTVYLPDTPNISYGTSAFAGANPSLSVICPSEAAFQTLRQAGIAGSGQALTYPLTLRFQAEGQTVAEKPVLYRRPICLSRQSGGSWAADKSYRLPSIPNSKEGYSCRWVFDPASDERITPDSLVTGALLTVSCTISPAQITPGKDIEKTYDGSAASLEITASHPLYSPEKDAKDGNVLFYYIWTWTQDGQTRTQKGYDLSTLSFTDAAEAQVKVKVQPSLKGSGETVPGALEHTFSVAIHRAEPEVKPILPSGALTAGEALPKLTLPDDCIPGSIVWDEGQALQEGEHSYSWTFTPADEKNYRPVTGSCILTAQAQTQPRPVCQLSIDVGANGRIAFERGVSPDSSGHISIQKGEALTFSILPEPGYTVDRLFLDGENVTGQIRELSYTFQHTAAKDCAGHKLSLSFRKMDSTDMENLMRGLPALTKDGSCDEKTKNAYLDAKIAYETLKKSRDLNISRQTLHSFYQSMQYLPSVHLDMDSASPVLLSDAFWLLEHMSLEDARGLRSGSITDFSLTVNAQKAALTSEQEREVLKQKKDARIAVSYLVTIQKTIKEKRASNNYYLSQLSRPITLRLSLPADLKGPADGYSRTYYVAEIHNEGNGRESISLLSASLDQSGKQVIAETSRFSIFSLIYVDQKKENKPAEEHGEESGGSSEESNHSSNTYVPDYEKEFWDSVTSLIKKAKAGETVNVNAVTYDKMPEAVMAALRENPNVALIVRWEGGDPVMIPARTALTKDKGRVYYPLSYLSTHYKALNAALIQQQKPGSTAPSTGGSGGSASSSGSHPGSSGSHSSGSSGGSKWDISAPPKKENSYTPTPEDHGVEAETESQTQAQETETVTENETPEITPETETAPQKDLELQLVTQKGDDGSMVTAIVLIVSIILLVLLIIIFVVLLTLKKRR